MADKVTGMPRRGKTYSGGTPASIAQSIALEGMQIYFADDLKDGVGVRKTRSSRMTHAVLVRNTAGFNLTPGRSVSWEAGFRGRRVDGYTATTAQEIAGYVDDQLPAAGVANNDLFWLLRKGPALIKTPTVGAAFAEGDILVALTAATSGADAAGRPAVVVAAATTNTYFHTVNRAARVMSAMTTAQTDANMLVDLELM